MCPERQFLFQSGGKLQRVRISSRTQISTLLLSAALIIGAATLALSLSWNRSEMERESAAINAKTRAIAEYKKSIEQRARDLEARQDFMDDLYHTHFGEDASQAGVALKNLSGQASTQGGADSSKVRISATQDIHPLGAIDARQRRFAALLTHAVKRRADETAHAIRRLGLNPDLLARAAPRAQGGPFVPWPDGQRPMPQEFERLSDALARMESLETSLKTIPSGLPTMAPMQSSSYGYRRDPFNGHAAFHAGIDFPGRHGEPILAAATGSVSFVGQRSGYGNVVEITHGNGLMTRYAHLSGFNARVGQQVLRGHQIARMGSTGRSTGDHLHFEVRLKGEPVNPRPFLEAARNVQQVAAARNADIRSRG
ncbi:peptidase M24 [Sphingobium sp. TomTYG75]